LRRFWREIVRREFAFGAANFDLRTDVGRKAGQVPEKLLPLAVWRVVK